ncbi:transporter [Ensifer sp.]|jgi:putative intracellular protease/amidase|uniref:transporter n=1 Tax=Ensifer sp. TaxID=1872086 RepID=UPI002E14EEFC|nr:transporter [Ensifer sp.]
MEGSQPIRFLVILCGGEGGEGLDCELELGHFAPAYYLFKDDGADVVLATLEGGHCDLPNFKRLASDAPDVGRFLADRSARDDLADTLGLHQIVIDDFDAALCLGFSGELWKGGGNEVVLLLRSLLDSGRPVAAIPGRDIALAPHGAAAGLLILGDAGDAPVMAAHALMKVAKERRLKA